MPREQEIFTDLSGKPDPVAGSETDLESLERGLATLSPKDSKIDDADLEVVGDDEIDTGAAEAEAEAARLAAAAADKPAPGTEPEEDEAEEVVTGAADFDPKDVVILTKDAELLDTREANLTQAEVRGKADVEAALDAMKKAKEAGDTDGDIAATKAYTAATIALRDATDGLKQVLADKAGLKARAQDLYARAPKDAAGKPILTGEPGKVRRAAKVDETKNRPSKLADAFRKLNPWFGHAKYKDQTELLKKLDAGLAAEGRLNKDDPAYFTELGRRMNAEKPGLYKNLDGKPIATGQRQRAAGGFIPGSGGGAGGGGGEQPVSQVKLVANDLVEMRKFGMDPDSKDHRRQWLQSKREIAAKDARAA